MGPFAIPRAFLVSVLCLVDSAQGGFFAASDVQRGKRAPHAGNVQRTTGRHVAAAHLSPAWVQLAQDKVRMGNADLRGAQDRDTTPETTTATPSDIKDARAEAAPSSPTTETDDKQCSALPRDQQKKTDNNSDAKIGQRFRVLSGGLGRAFTPGSLSPADRMKTGTLEPAASEDNSKNVKAVARAGAKMRGGGSTPPGKPPSQRLSNAVEGIKNGLASGLAAACVKTVLQPFDTLKTVQQFSTSKMSLFEAGRVLIARGGVMELYVGLKVTVLGSIPSVGVYFGLYQFTKRQMDAIEGVSPALSIIVSAGVGNFIASFFRVPYEVVKQRLQVGAYPSTMVALQSIYDEGGLLGFFAKGGLKMQWARDIPYAMVTLLVYETLQKAAARRRGPDGAKKSSPIENMVIGAVAGGMGSLVTNPMDMIKTRMMTSPELFAGPMDAAWIALRNEGPQAFMKGAAPRLLHKIPANAFFFVTYEFFRTVLGVTR